MSTSAALLMIFVSVVIGLVSKTTSHGQDKNQLVNKSLSLYLFPQVLQLQKVNGSAFITSKMYLYNSFDGYNFSRILTVRNTFCKTRFSYSSERKPSLQKCRQIYAIPKDKHILLGSMFYQGRGYVMQTDRRAIFGENTTTLYSPMTMLTEDHCLRFEYHMFGVQPGPFSVLLYQDSYIRLV